MSPPLEQNSFGVNKDQVLLAFETQAPTSESETNEVCNKYLWN